MKILACAALAVFCFSACQQTVFIPADTHEITKHEIIGYIDSIKSNGGDVNDAWWVVVNHTMSDSECVAYLLKCGGDPNYRLNHVPVLSPLTRSLPEAEALIQAGANVDPDVWGFYKPLYQNLLRGYPLSVAKRLIERGASMDVRCGSDSNSSPPEQGSTYQLVGCSGDVDFLKFLDARGLKDHDATLMTAIIAHRIPMIRYLLETDSSLISSPDKDLTSWACFGGTFDSPDIGALDVVKVLISYGVKIPKQSGALYWAARLNDHELIRILIQHGADPNAVPPIYGHFIFDVFQEPETVKLLVSLGANVNASNVDGETPISLAEKELKDYKDPEDIARVKAHIKLLKSLSTHASKS